MLCSNYNKWWSGNNNMRSQTPKQFPLISVDDLTLKVQDPLLDSTPVAPLLLQLIPPLVGVWGTRHALEALLLLMIWSRPTSLGVEDLDERRNIIGEFRISNPILVKSKMGLIGTTTVLTSTLNYHSPRPSWVKWFQIDLRNSSWSHMIVPWISLIIIGL